MNRRGFVGVLVGMLAVATLPVRRRLGWDSWERRQERARVMWDVYHREDYERLTASTDRFFVTDGTKTVCLSTDILVVPPQETIVSEDELKRFLS